MNRTREHRWLKDELQLAYNPFEELEAGQDARLASYLVDHGVYEALRKPGKTLLIAERGGGKSAFRVRLAYDCRVRRYGKIMPVLLRLPGPGWAATDDALWRWLNEALAAEVLLEFAYRPHEFESLEPSARKYLVNFVRAYYESARIFIPAMKAASQHGIDADRPLSILLDSVDPAMKGLPAQPLSGSIADFADEWMGVEARPINHNHQDNWERAIRWLLDEAGFDHIYLLVDGIDDWAISLDKQETIMRWIDERGSERVSLKDFAPPAKDLNGLDLKSLLTNEGCPHTISWTKDSLQQVVYYRIHAASMGAFNALSALGDDTFPARVEEQLVDTIHPKIPRELLYVVKRVFECHLENAGPTGRLSGRDLECAKAGYS